MNSTQADCPYRGKLMEFMESGVGGEWRESFDKNGIWHGCGNCCSWMKAKKNG